MRAARTVVALLVVTALPHGLGAQAVPPSPPSRAQVIAAAVDVMQTARYATLITIGDNGQPQARIVDAFAPETNLAIWIATNPVTRKVHEIQRDPRVTLLYFDATRFEYVTVLGKAELVADSAEKARHWKEAWGGLYKDENRGDDYVLIRVHPSRLEVVSPRHGLTNDPTTWRPVVVDLP